MFDKPTKVVNLKHTKNPQPPDFDSWNYEEGSNRLDELHAEARTLYKFIEQLVSEYDRNEYTMTIPEIIEKARKLIE